MEENFKFKKAIKKIIAFFIVVLALGIVGLMILRYYVEGEKNMPFNLSELTVVSSAEGIKRDETNENNWNVDVYQTNDVYINIKKNKNYKETEVIKNIEIRNINIEQKPALGNVSIYIPSDDNKTFNYKEEKKVNNEIKFEGDLKSDISNLKISNQGGTIIFRIINNIEKTYTSNDEELKHDGTLINKIGVNNSDIKFKISFDVIINLESDLSFVGKVNLELPIEDVTTNGVTSLNKENTKDIIFKRE